jgi:hypothetical protein
VRDQSKTGQATGHATAAATSDGQWGQITWIGLRWIAGGQIDAKFRLDPVVVLGGSKTGTHGVDECPKATFLAKLQLKWVLYPWPARMQYQATYFPIRILKGLKSRAVIDFDFKRSVRFPSTMAVALLTTITRSSAHISSPSKNALAYLSALDSPNC